MTLKKNINERGFTIVELLIVIIVIGILATLVLVAYNNVQAQARDAKRQANASSLRDAAATYKGGSTLGYYPRNSFSGSPATSDFLTDVSTATNYTGQTAAVSLDTALANLISTSAPASATPDTIQVTYCPALATYQTATGMKFVYWSELNKGGSNLQPPVFTGTTC